jgi:hypothetical protein
VRKPELPSDVRHGDLAVVHVARKHELKCPQCQAVEDSRKVTEQNPEVGSWLCKGTRLGKTPAKRTWVDAHDLDATAVELNRFRLVDE